jgi:hypothetical protein
MEEGKREDAERRIDESWKDAVEKEKRSADEKSGIPPVEMTFNLFITGLMMEALVALGEAENPVTKKKESNRDQAQLIIDTLSMLKDKTKNNLTKDESAMLDAILYELRMKFVAGTNSTG